jgi:hypothetical protein
MSLTDIIALFSAVVSVACASAAGAWSLSRLWDKIDGRFGNIDARLRLLELRLSSESDHQSRAAKMRGLHLRM